MLGLDGDVLESALILMRDKYHLATEANTFLETRTGVSGISIAITNQRDAVTHLITLLRAPSADRDAQLKQLANLEEHIRRACMEPYEAAVNITMVALDEVVEQYKSLVLSLPHLGTVAPAAPTLEEINQRVAAVARLRRDGRMAKTENQWNRQWEDGLKHFILAFDELDRLKTELDTLISRVQQVRAGRTAARRSIALVVIGSVLGVMLRIAWDYLR